MSSTSSGRATRSGIFRISKFSIPWLRHPAVPRTWFLDRVETLPPPREQLLLKPLFSFAGGGIVFAPSDDQLAAIPTADASQYILQEKITFEPVIDTPHGPTQAEIRMMFVWTGSSCVPCCRWSAWAAANDGRRPQQRPPLGRRLRRLPRLTRVPGSGDRVLGAGGWRLCR